MNSLRCRASAVVASAVIIGLAILAMGHFARMGAQSTSYSILYMFPSGTSGAFPYGGLLLDSAGDLFGTTYDLGKGLDPGLIFKLSSGGNYGVLYTFKGSPRDGGAPRAGLITDRAGNLYGTTLFGGSSNEGTVFALTPAGKEVVLHAFAGTPNDGALPVAPLLAGKGGIYYGTTTAGGASGPGTVFELNAKTRQLTTLHSFGGTGDGANPNGGLISDSSGNLYGTTVAGGAYNNGTLFEVTTTGAETVLYSFTGGADGGSPYGSLLRNAAGDLYTTTFSGGANGLGAIVKWSENGKEFVLYSFGGPDGANPYAPIIRDTNGDFLGTTFNGGANGLGVAFEFDNTQHYTVLHSFTGGTSDGANPYAPLVRDSAGNLYGTTVNGGSTACTGGCGTIFKITP